MAAGFNRMIKADVVGALMKRAAAIFLQFRSLGQGVLQAQPHEPQASVCSLAACTS